MELSLTNVAEAVASAINEVFEAMVFMEAMPGTDEHRPAADEPVFCTRLPIYKPSPALVSLIIPRKLALTLAETMMMRECNMEDDEFEVMDVLSELSNTLAGSLLAHLMPDSDSFELGLPECRVLGNGVTDKEWAGAEEYLFHVDGTGFYFTWEASSPVAM